MSGSPRVSIVVPAAPGDRSATLQSLSAQDYAALEVIEVREGDLAHALERGFEGAQGEVLGYLLPGEILLPGALARLAGIISPTHPVVLGGALYLVGGSPGIGVPHPREYAGIDDYLAIWNRGFDPVPRASLFWHRSIAPCIGRFTPGPAYAVDYDLVCRIGKRYPIRLVDDTWSAIPVRPAIESERRMLETWIALSRRHWGPWISGRRWRCAVSYRRFRLQPHQHALHHARQAELARAQGRALVAFLHRLQTRLYSPSLARGRFGR